MKLRIKQLIALLLLVIFTIFLDFIVYFIGRHLYNFRITDLFIRNREIHSLIIVFLHFLIGYVLINKIQFLKRINNLNIILSFFIFYLIIPIIIWALKSNSEPFHYGYLKELSGIIGLTIGLIFRNKERWYFSIISFLIIGIFLLFTNNIILPLSSQFHLYKNFLGKSNSYNIIKSLNLINSKGNSINIDNSKIIVIDFWNKNCGLCFRKFPKLRKLQQEFINDNRVIVLAVNVYSNKNEIEVSEKLLKKTGNKELINYYMTKEDAKIFNLEWYPKVIVIKDNSIIFEGNVETLDLFKNLYLK